MRVWIAAALLLLSACGRAPDVATYLTLNFEDGPPLHDAIASGFGEYSNAVSAYPNLVEAQYVDVLAGAGVGGGAGLGFIEGEGYDWDYAYFTYAVMAAYPDWELTPAEDVGKGRAQFDVIFSETRMEVVGGWEWALFGINSGYYDSVSAIILALDNYGHTKGAYDWKLTWWATTGGAHQNPTRPTSPFRKVVSAGTFDDLVDGQKHTVELTWQCGTLTQWASSTDMTITADGWIKLKVDGVIVIHEQNIPMVVNPYGDKAGYGLPRSQANVNRFTAFDIGNWTNGFPGVFDNIIIGTPEADTWVDIAEFLDVPIASSAFPSGAARVLGYLWSSDASAVLQARLYNVTDGSSSGESAELSGDTPQACDFAVTLASGTKNYRLQVTSDTPDTDIFMSSRGVGP